MKLTPSQKRRAERKRIYKKAHNIIHNNVRVDMRIHYYPITTKKARMFLPLLQKQLKSLNGIGIIHAKSASAK